MALLIASGAATTGSISMAARRAELVESADIVGGARGDLEDGAVVLHGEYLVADDEAAGQEGADVRLGGMRFEVGVGQAHGVGDGAAKAGAVGEALLEEDVYDAFAGGGGGFARGLGGVGVTTPAAVRDSTISSCVMRFKRCTNPAQEDAGPSNRKYIAGSHFHIATVMLRNCFVAPYPRRGRRWKQLPPAG